MPRKRAAIYCLEMLARRNLLLHRFVVEQAGYAQLDQLFERQIVEAVPAGLGDEVIVDMEDASLNDVLGGDAWKLLFERSRIFRRCALDTEIEKLFGAEAVESRSLHPRHEFRRDVEDAERDSFLHVVDVKALLLQVGNVLGGDSLDLAGDQIVGARGADAYVLGVAAALEKLLDADPRTARPLPDLGKLRSSRPIAEMPGFLG